MLNKLLRVLSFVLAVFIPLSSHAAQVSVITTAAVTGVRQFTAQCGGNITSDGGATVTARGVCWSINQSPTLNDHKTTDGTEAGSFASRITGLTPGTLYYVRAYATNSASTGYGNAISFTTLTFSGTVTDIDGNVYQTVTNGTQVWMAENLKVTRYRNGDFIPNVTDDGSWADLTTGAYCNYNNDVANVAVYGRLYNWYAVNDSRTIAPAGWHVPTDDEWQTLENYLGGYAIAGRKMKEAGTMHWDYPNEEATNESGFSAVPGRFRNYEGYCYYKGCSVAWFWSSTEAFSSDAWYRFLHSDNSAVTRSYSDMHDGLSIRCVKDQ